MSNRKTGGTTDAVAATYRREAIFVHSRPCLGRGKAMRSTMISVMPTEMQCPVIYKPHHLRICAVHVCGRIVNGRR